MEIVSKEYRSWGEYLDAARALPPSASVYGDDKIGARTWAGAANVGEALQIAEHGWREGMARVRSITMPIVTGLAARIETDDGWGYDVTGAAYDVGEYLQGVPECWLSPTHVTEKPCVTIMVNVTTSAGIPKEMIELRGAGVVALALALQAGGFAVRVYKCEGYPVGSTGKLACHRVCLTDDAGGPIDTDRLLYALAHPSAARCIGYALGTRLAGAEIGTYLGAPTDPPDSLGWGSDLFLPRAYLDDANWRSPASVERWVQEQYAILSGKAQV
jgi:hypothetical protein